MMSRLVPLLFLAVSCSPHPLPSAAPNPLQPPLRSTQNDAPEPPLPSGPDITDQIMGFVVVSDAAKIAEQLSPPPVDPDSRPNPRQAAAELARALGLDAEVAQVLDLRRPLALAMLNPSLLSTQEVRPYVAALPVTSRAEVMELLSKKGPVTVTPWGAEWTTASGQLFIGFQRGYAMVAWRKDLLGPAARLLRPKLNERAEAPLRVHLDMTNLYAAYGPQINAVVGRFAQVAAQGGAGGDPQLGYALRQVRALAPYLKSFSGFNLFGDLDSGGLTLTIGLEGKPGGAWADYVGQQQPGPAWGVRFLPKDAVLAYTTKLSKKGGVAEADALVDYMTHLSSAGDHAHWRDVLQRAVSTTGGEVAYAVWPARGGGVGMGGAYRLSDPGGARDAINAAYQELAGPLSPVVLRGLSLDPARFAHRVTVKRSRAQVGDIEADLIEVTVKWPAGTDAERRNFEAMFGPKLVMATAYQGEAALFALGADWAERLSTMLKVAAGEGAASLGDEPSFVEALSFRDRDRVSLTYLDTARMARFAAGMMTQTRDLRPDEQAAVTALLREVGRGAIVSTTNASSASGTARYQLTTHLPPGAVAGAAQLHGALWRMALAPLLNPPAMPPIPMPPPHVSPGVPQTGAPM